MNLREPLAIPADRPLDVLIHTRYSTDEQSQSSIDGQINSCQRFLTANLPRDWKPEQVGAGHPTHSTSSRSSIVSIPSVIWSAFVILRA
jgi:hypothetical protein